MDDAIYDEDVNYDALEQHTYEDSGDAVFYTCPLAAESILLRSLPNRMVRRCA